jgi:hypothetical protein
MCFLRVESSVETRASEDIRDAVERRGNGGTPYRSTI